MSELRPAYVTGAPRRLELTVQGIPPSPNDHMHPRAKWRIYCQFRDATAWQVKASHRGPPMPYARAAFTIMKRGIPHDPDNATALLKCLVDALKIGGAIVDDNGAHLIVIVTQARGGKAERCVRILVEELEAIP